MTRGRKLIEALEDKDWATVNKIIKKYNHSIDNVETFFLTSDDPKPMPELKTGMFIWDQYANLGVICGNKIVYQNGNWDTVETLDKDDILAIYGDDMPAFNCVCKSYLIWEREPEDDD